MTGKPLHHRPEEYRPVAGANVSEGFRGFLVDLPDVRALPWMKIQAPKGLEKVPTATDLGAGEKEVLALLLDGCDNASIARARGTSARTTANQVASIFRKLGVASRAELAAKISAP